LLASSHSILILYQTGFYEISIASAFDECLACSVVALLAWNKCFRDAYLTKRFQCAAKVRFGQNIYDVKSAKESHVL